MHKFSLETDLFKNLYFLYFLFLKLSVVLPEIKLTSFGEIEIQEGEKARIATCSAENSNPAAEVQWRDKNGKISEGIVENSNTAENGLSSVTNTLEVR